jgi:hypothetical protein
MKKMSWISLVVITVCLLSSSGLSQAYLIDTGTPTMPAGAAIGGAAWFMYGAQFTVPEGNTYVITSIQGYYSVDEGGSVYTSLVNDVSGLPGVSILSSATPLSNSGWYGLTGLNLSLSSGKYWVVLIGDPFLINYVGTSSPDPLSPEAQWYGPPVNWVTASRGLGVRIDGQAIATPEPCIILLLGLGLIGLAEIRNKFSN